MKLQNIFRFVPATILLLLLIHSPLFSQFSKYKATFIPNFSGCDINDSSEIVGDNNNECLKWKKGVLTTLPSLYDFSILQGINNASQVVGSSVDRSNDPILQKATFWPNSTTVIDLGTLPDDNESIAFSINSSGVICGASYYDTGKGIIRATPFVYDGKMTAYPVNDLLAGAVDINDNGWVLVRDNFGSTPTKVYILHDGIIEATTPEFIAYRINNKNEVAGRQIDSGACYWKNGTLTRLPDGLWANVADINDSGLILGYYGSMIDLHSVLWKDGKRIDLDTLVPLPCRSCTPRAVNNKGEIICVGLSPDRTTSGTYLLIPDSAEITIPREGDTRIAGEQDTIRWTGIAKGVSLLIEYSSDDGQTYQAIAGNIPADSGKYVWDIPKDILSAKCYVRLRNNSTLDTLAVSEKFKVKPYMITQMDPSGDFRQYDIGVDRWGFGNTRAEIYPMSWYSRFNYRGIDPFTGRTYDQYAGNEVFRYAVPADFPDWVSFVNTFTINACYWNKAQGIYSQTALDRWGVIKDVWRGSCFGIATTNALAFERKTDFLSYFPQYPTFNEAIAVASDTNTIPVVNEVFTNQFGNPHKAHDSYGFSRWPTQTLGDIKDQFRKDDVPLQALTIWKNNGGGAHTILGWKLQRVAGQAGIFHLRVYDNSYPADTSAYILIDSASDGGKGTWYYANLPAWGGAKWFYLEDSSRTYLVPPSLPKSQGRISPFIINSSELQVLTRREASVLIEDQQGKKTGFMGDTIMTEIPGSVPLMIKDGSETSPYGYMMPAGTYSFQMSSFTDSVARASFCTGNKTYSYERHGATQLQSDRLFYDGGVSVKNPDPDAKPITLQSIIKNITDEKIFLVRSFSLSQNDSVKFDYVEEAKYKLASFGTAKSYLLEIQQSSDSGLVRFRTSDVLVDSNTTHTIEPNWGDLDNSLLNILVDVGNDGTIDDTLKLQNELTGIHDHGSLIPSEYKLHQNYPNPFNPVTTIPFDIPKASFVTLKVYNVLGQEVAVLLDEKREAGSYEVEFDGSKLTSGVYFYQLKAGIFTETKKLLLVR